MSKAEITCSGADEVAKTFGRLAVVASLVDWNLQRRIRFPYNVNAPRNDNWLPFGAERCGCGRRL